MGAWWVRTRLVRMSVRFRYVVRRRPARVSCAYGPGCGTLWRHVSTQVTTSVRPLARQVKLRAASGLGPPRPIGRCVLAGRPYRHVSTPVRGMRSSAVRQLPRVDCSSLFSLSAQH